ncbi:MAG: FadR family transcriptional regulator [Desulfovibrio sp.]|mgnify:CR=1 FL=1|nr:MAG: FadR family transcriptional regulator [Desulfovibrio sp.]
MNSTVLPLFSPITFGRASEEIVLQVEAAIVDGRLAPGERLPSEREMQRQFGKGRGVIREAIKTLVQKGLLEVRKGAKGGAYVRKLDVGKVSESLALFLKQEPVAPEHLIEFRESIDRAITQLAMTRAAQEDKDELHAKARQLEALLAQDDPDLTVTGELDRELNLMLARMAGNPLLEWVMQALQMGLGSSDHALYEDPVFREKAAANWSDTAGAIARGELMQALGFIGHHYVLLRQCVRSRSQGSPETEIPFLADSSETP